MEISDSLEDFFKSEDFTDNNIYDFDDVYTNDDMKIFAQRYYNHMRVEDAKNSFNEEIYNHLEDSVRHTVKYEYEPVFDREVGKYSNKYKKSSILKSVIKELKNREKVGFEKYNTTLDRKDLTISDWIQHAKEEALDLAMYLEKIKSVMEWDKE